MKDFPEVLVLTGGGARGAYQAGVLCELAERGIAFRHIFGSSAGAVNAYIYSIGLGKKAPELWMDFATGKKRVWDSDILRSDMTLDIGELYRDARPTAWEFARYIVGGRAAKKEVFGIWAGRILDRGGLVSFRPMARTLHELAKGRENLCSTVTVLVTDAGYRSVEKTYNGGLNVHNLQFAEGLSIQDAVAASSAFPVIVERVEGYKDGGMGDRSVVQAAAAKFHDDELLIVDNGDVKPAPLPVANWTLLDHLRRTLDYLIDVNEVDSYRPKDSVILRCERTASRTDFSPETVSALIQEGKKDARNMLAGMAELGNNDR